MGCCLAQPSSTALLTSVHSWIPREPLGQQHANCSGQDSPVQGPKHVELTDIFFLPPQYKADTLKSARMGQDLKEEHPWVDYTSPSLITLLFTDLGVLTPSAVSDELIKLYL